MTVFIVETFFVKPERQSEFKLFLQKWRKYRKENKEKFKEMKSWKIFTQTLGSICGAYIEQMGFDSLAEYKKRRARLRKDKGYSKLRQEGLSLIDITTFSMSVWEPVK